MQISGYDLRNLYSKWGLVLDSYYQQKLDSMINNGNYLTPPCNDNLYLVTPFSKPCPDLTLPLPLKGINTSSPQPDLMPANQLASKISTVITVQKQASLPTLVTENLMHIKIRKQ